MTDTEHPACARGCEVPGAHAVTHPAGSTCPGCLPRPAMRGTTVCSHCADLFTAALKDLAMLWPDITVGVARDRTSSSTTGRVQNSRIADVGDYWRPRVAQLQTDTLAWLEYLTVVLADLPPLNGTQLADLSPQHLLLTLSIIARRILTSTPALAVGLVKEALRLRGRTWRALESSWVRRIPLADAHCPAPVYVDYPDGNGGTDTIEQRCNGDLVAILQPIDAGGDSAVVCSHYPLEHAVRPEQWSALADQIADLLA